MLVPGVSGGSMAMILGIYQELISAVSSFRKQKKSNFLILPCAGRMFRCIRMISTKLLLKPR